MPKREGIQILLRKFPMTLQSEEYPIKCLVFLYFSVRSPQWLRSKWWALKKHVPEMEATSFEAIYSYLYETYTATLQNKIDRQEARFKGNHLPSVSTVIPAGRPVHINPISTGAVTNSGICHTITGTLINL